MNPNKNTLAELASRFNLATEPKNEGFYLFHRWESEAMQQAFRLSDFVVSSVCGPCYFMLPRK